MGLASCPPIIIINFLEKLDAALIRPGQIDQKVEFKLTLL